jgi:hypothetical protein
MDLSSQRGHKQYITAKAQKTPAKISPAELLYLRVR